MRKETHIKLHAAATIFAQHNGCSAQHIADILKVPLNSVYHYAKHPEWNEALDTLGYTGNRQFETKITRDAMKDSGALVAQARELYIFNRQQGVSHKKSVTNACHHIGIDRRRVNNWHKRYNWEQHL